MIERRSGQPRSRSLQMALWLLVLGLALAPNLALAAAACAPACCPAEAEPEDCGSGFDRRACCEMSPTSFEAFPQAPVETPVPAALPVRIAPAPAERVELRARFLAARVALSTSPLRLSVVLRL